MIRLFSRVDPSVHFEAAGLREPPSADVAAVHLFPRMNHCVHLEIAGVAELLTALLTGVRLLSCVDAHVVFEVDHAAEFLATCFANRLLPCFLPSVDPHVVLERARVSAAFATGLADVRPLPRVGKHVVLQGTPVTAAFAANLTREKLFSRVFAQMFFEDAATIKAVHMAAVLLLHMSHPVSGQGQRREETLAAHFADEISVSRM